METYSSNPKALANYVANELQRERSQAEGDGYLPMEQVRLSPQNLAGLVRLIDDGKLTKQQAKDVIVDMFQGGQSAEAVMEARGIKPVEQDSGQLEEWCREAVAGNAVAAQQVREGNDKAINSFIGPVMKASKGTANPQAAREMLQKIISEG